MTPEPKNPGTTTDARFPAAAPHDPDAPHVRRATVRVDAADPVGPLPPIWASIGYDEINWTAMPTGKRLLRTLGELSPVPFHVRPHNLFTSGTGFGLPHFGSGNVYHEGADGEPFFDFAIVDATFDAIVAGGHHVLVELGFTPLGLVPDHAFAEFTVPDSPSLYSAYEAGQWGYPPKDLRRWGLLVEALARHSLERYGEAEVSTWLWELWNEPDIFYWRGTQEEFHELYAVTSAAVRSVLPGAAVGGPAVTGGPGGVDFLRGFLASVDERGLPLDFVSAHTKGSAFTPWRTYGPTGGPAPELQSPQTTKMLHEIRSVLRAVAEVPRFADLPVVIDECDAGVPAHWGVYDNANFAFQNTEYYPAFQLNLMKKLLDLNDRETASVTQATTWSFYFEGERFFEGTRAFLTAGGVEKPLLNAYRMLAHLGGTRLAAESDAAWTVDALDATVPAACPEEVDVLASLADDGEIAVVVYRRTDDQHQTDDEDADVVVRIDGLGSGARSLRHLRIDAHHSNAHTVWQDLGQPQDPTPEQLAAMHERMGLEQLEPDSTVEPTDGRVELRLALPLGGASLLLIGAQR